MSEQSERTLKKILSEAHAAEAEAQGEHENAIRLYKEAIATDKLNEEAYTRLMIIFRKHKRYKEELSIIAHAIKVFEQLYQNRVPKKSKSITTLSNKLSKAFGLTDKKGNVLFNPEPIATWKKRKEVLQKKTKK